MLPNPDRYLLDTNIWSALIRRSHTGLNQRFAALPFGCLVLSPIVLAELQVGYYKGDRTPKRLSVIETIRANTTLLTNVATTVSTGLNHPRSPQHPARANQR